MNYLNNLTRKNKIYLGIFILLLMVVPMTVFVVSKSELLNTRSQADLSGDIKLLSQKLLADQGNEQEQIATSIQRKELVSKLAKTDPESFLLYAITGDIKKTLPNLAQENIETKTVIEGTIIENVSEHEEPGADPVAPFAIQTIDPQGFTTRAYLIYLREGMDLRAGQTARIQGYGVDNILVPTKIEILSSPPSEIQTEQTNTTDQDVLGVSTTGTNKKIAVLMVNFKNDLSDTRNQLTREELAEIYFTGNPSTTKYLKNASSNQLNFQGDINDVYGWVTIPNFTRKQACDINETSDGAGWKKAAINKAKAQATERGINFDDYEFIGFVFPYSNVCDWGSAIASGVGNVDSYAKPHHFLNGDYCANSSNCNSKDKKFYAGLLAHEVGHNLGLSHANGLNCGNKIIDNYANCKSITYGDRFDLIGGTWTYFPNSSSANQQIRLGWIPPENRRNVNENNINSTGTYTLHSASLKKAPGDIQFIRIPRPVDGGAYYLEYRTKHGQDSNIPQKITQGTLVRLSEIPNGVLKNESGSLQYRPQQTYLLDMSNGNPTYWTQFDDPSLRDGKIFEDTRNKIKITQLSHDETNGTANLKIELGPPPCLLAHPRMILSEPSLSGLAGETVRYEITVTNMNSESCATTNFNLSATSPTGWTTKFTANQLNIASSQSKIAYIDVTAPLNAAPGSNPYLTEVTVKNAGNQAYFKTKPISYSVEETSVTTPPATNTPSPTTKPSNTPIPTKLPSSTPSPSPRPSSTPSPLPPTQGPTATNTPSPLPGNTIIHFPSIKLHGIGSGGTNQNPNAPGNNNPLTKTRNLIVDILDANNNLVSRVQGNIIYKPETGDFTGDIAVPSSVASDRYLLKVRSDKHITKQVGGILNLTQGATNLANPASLTTGDTNLDDKLNTLDYNIIVDCYSDFVAPKNCNNAGKKLRADLNDDGLVNRIDFALFLREISVQAGN